MAACLELDLAFPDIPPFFVAGPVVPNIPLPATIGAFCCKFSVPDFLGLNVAIAALNVAIASAGAEANAVVSMVEAEIIAAAAPILAYAISVRVNCPLE